MLRGSRPGERRGGRKQGTPNRRTILRDRILSIGLDHPAASQPALLLKLIKDRTLPADIRMAVAPKSFPPKRRRSSRTERPEALAIEGSGVGSNGSQSFTGVPAIRDWTPQALDALIGVVQEATADPKVRRKAALKIAEFLLPKVGRKAKLIPDEYGFSISPNLASAYRDIQLELRALVNAPTHKIPAIAEKIEKLEARSDAIRRRLQLPCPTKYGTKEAGKDWGRLMGFTSLRDNETALTETQKAEEAHLMARFDVYDASPESIARRRREALESAEGRFKASRRTGDFYAPPLSRQERSDLKLLRWLYPKRLPNRSQLDGDDGLDMYLDHPFADALRAPNGNFYPRQSKLRWLEQLGTIGRKKLTAKEDPEDQQKPELLAKSRMHDLEERRAVGLALTGSEEQELRDLRERHPEFAAVVDLMDLSFLYYWRREVEIARKASLNSVAMFEQADLICLRWRDPTKFTTESDAEEYRRVRSAKATEAAALEP
jgi:hypothetical protein